ncbi:MAG: response regulator, partial [Verrucomicrobiota bacterium]
MSEVSPEANRRILVVDDNPAIHDDFRKILALVNDATELDLEEAAVFGEPAPAKWQEPFEIDSAYQGAEAVELLRKANELGRPYAMAFVDMRMPPGMNGLETIARLWALSSELQVVICTAYSDHSWREMIQSLGKTDRLLILKKPFDPIEVLQLAHAVTSKWQLGRQVRNRVEDLELRVAERTRELLSANEKLGEQAALLDHARDAILVRDMADRLLYWNRSAETLYEWPAAQAIGRG